MDIIKHEKGRLAVGATVLAVRGNNGTIQPDGRNIGRIGVVTKEYKLGNEYYYDVEFDHDGQRVTDQIDGVNLQEVRYVK